MKKRLLNVATIVALLFSAVACNEEEPAVDNNNPGTTIEEPEVIPTNFDIFSTCRVQ